MFKFGEKQGRLVVEVTLYLEQDLNNEELEKVYNELELNPKHKLLSDYEIKPVT